MHKNAKKVRKKGGWEGEFIERFGYVANNLLLCTAFAQSLSREEMLGMLRCNDKTI